MKGAPLVEGLPSRSGAKPAKAWNARSDGRGHGFQFGTMAGDFNNYIITLGFKK
jgi:hypothetical protein